MSNPTPSLEELRDILKRTRAEARRGKRAGEEGLRFGDAERAITALIQEEVRKELEALDEQIATNNWHKQEAHQICTYIKDRLKELGGGNDE